METRLHFEIEPQPNDISCGPTCLHALYAYYGDGLPLEQVIDEIPQVEVTLGNLQINGQPAPVAAVTAVYPPGVPDFADAVRNGDAVTVTVGQPVANRTERNVRLSAP